MLTVIVTRLHGTHKLLNEGSGSVSGFIQLTCFTAAIFFVVCRLLDLSSRTCFLVVVVIYDIAYKLLSKCTVVFSKQNAASGQSGDILLLSFGNRDLGTATKKLSLSTRHVVDESFAAEGVLRDLAGVGSLGVSLALVQIHADRHGLRNLCVSILCHIGFRRVRVARDDVVITGRQLR